MLYDHVIEAGERVSAEGDVLHPLEEDRLAADLREARAGGINACAIVFMHGYKYPAHEARAAQIAREARFTRCPPVTTPCGDEICVTGRYHGGGCVSLACFIALREPHFGSVTKRQ